MARISQDDFSGQSEASGTKTLNIDANDQQSIEVPSNDFISDAQMSREGQDLVLEAPNGDTLVINNYFMADPAPMIESPDGSILTSSLVNSFLNSPSQFAQASTMADESPVGAVEEMSGEASVIHADGTSEPITLGTPIYQGDIVETSSNGAVNIVFIDETSMAVSQNARLAVDEYSFDPSTESGETNLSVLRGVFVFTSGLIGRDDPDDVMIDTPVGSIGIRGTIIAGNINPSGESEITVMEGAIVIKNGSMETTLSQQYESVQLHGFHDKIHNTGIKNAHNMGKTYGSVSDVVPKLFSSINDTAKEEKHEATKDAKEQAVDEPNAEKTEEQKELAPEEKSEKPLPENILENNVKFGHEKIHLNHEKDHGRFDNKGKHLGQFKNSHDRDIGGELPIHFIGDKVTTPPTFNFQTKPVFEHAKTGDVVAKILIENAPSGVSFTLSDPTNFNLVQINNGYAEVRLNSAGQAIANTTPGAVLGSTTIIATFTNGHTETWTINPVTVDASVNIGGPQGLDVEVNNIGIASLHTKTFDLNNDGHDEVINSNPNATIAFTNDGQVSVTDGQTSGTTALNNPSPSTGDTFGKSFDSIGDFNGDGRTDFIVGQPGNSGKAFIYTDNTGNPALSIIDNAGGGGNGFGAFVSGLGDINGDGLSDVLVGSDGANNEAYVFLGGNSNIYTNSLSGSEGFKIVTGANKIIAGGFVGDTNGDGFDDFAISLEMGSNVNTYILYGKNGFPGTVDMTYLENPDYALKIHHAGAAADADTYGYNVGSAGDIDGDGFDDVQVGVTGQNQFVVHGDIGGDNVPYATDGSTTDGTADAGILSPANSSVKALVGDVNFIDNSETGLSMKGGGSNNSFSITNASFKNIDGGEGIDTIRYGASGGTLDFTNINFEQISQIERIQFTKNGDTIRLTAENIFNLLKSSDDGSLTIELGGTTGGGPATNASLQIDDLGITTTGSTENKIKELLDQYGDGAIDGDVVYNGINGDGNHHYQIGNYNLYIENNVSDLAVAIV